jgi:hypothetical protein
MQIVAVLIVLVVACDSNRATDCAAAADHLVTFQADGGDKQQSSAAITASCEKMKWTAGAVDCVEALKRLADMRNCLSLMTSDQRVALDNAIASPAPMPHIAIMRTWRLAKTADDCATISVDPECLITHCAGGPPQRYACPANLALPEIISGDGDVCEIDPDPVQCAPDASCNPPPPRTVPCPK